MTRRVVLVGGGHSHALSLLSLSRRCPPDTRLTLISDCRYAPYSGMLPGFIGGQFSRQECLIDLSALCKAVNVEWVEATAAAIDGDKRTVTLHNGAVEKFSLLSVNVGGAPKPPFVGGVAVKPALAFMDWLQQCDLSSAAVVGAGAGGVETALALRRRFPAATISLVGDSLLSAGNDGARRRLKPILAARNIALFESAMIQLQNKTLSLKDGRQITADEIIYATPVAAPSWLRQSDLALDADGFVRVDECLRSVSAAAVFAAGDCAASGAPKSGVIAVRQAPVLAHNIAAVLHGKPLRSWRMRRRLFILNTADGRAIAGWGGLSAAGGWVWRWKCYLDKNFMKQFLFG